MILDSPEQEWEVVAIEPTRRDGQRASLRGYPLPGKNMPIPIMQGRLTPRSPGSAVTAAVPEAE